MVDTGSTAGTGDTDGPDGADGPACELAPEQGPALLDFGLCVMMGTDVVIGACGNTGVHRRCDETFLAWCNAQGADVSACAEDEALAALYTVPCGTGANAAACDLTFRDNCDSLDGTMACYDQACCVGACQPPPQFACVDVSWSCTSADGKKHKGTCHIEGVIPVGDARRCITQITSACGAGEGKVSLEYETC